jgi:hypothetical protein
MVASNRVAQRHQRRGNIKVVTSPRVTSTVDFNAASAYFWRREGGNDVCRDRFKGFTWEREREPSVTAITRVVVIIKLGWW